AGRGARGPTDPHCSKSPGNGLRCGAGLAGAQGEDRGVCLRQSGAGDPRYRRAHRRPHQRLGPHRLALHLEPPGRDAGLGDVARPVGRAPARRRDGGPGVVLRRALDAPGRRHHAGDRLGAGGGAAGAARSSRAVARVGPHPRAGLDRLKGEGVTSVWLSGPEDDITKEIAGRLAGCTVSRAAAPPQGAEVAVYRPRLSGGKPDLAEAEEVFKAAGALPRFVLLSSAAVHAPHHHNLGYVPETYRSQGSNPIAAAWAELEARFAARLPQAERIVLRPAPVPARGGGDPWSRLLSGRAAAVPPGFDPALQFLAPEDLA